MAKVERVTVRRSWTAQPKEYESVGAAVTLEAEVSVLDDPETVRRELADQAWTAVMAMVEEQVTAVRGSSGPPVEDYVR